MAERISEELKNAIREMPEAEKNKLLLRLVAKDAMLMRQLDHKLLGDESEAVEQRETLACEADEAFSESDFAFFHHTPGLIMMALRQLSGAISRHVKVTRDRYGEISLNVLLVNLPFRYHQEVLTKQSHRADTFAPYVCKKAQTALKKLSKLNADYYIEFEEDVNEMLRHLHSYRPTARLAAEHGLPAVWEG